MGVGIGCICCFFFGWVGGGDIVGSLWCVGDF